MAVCRYEMKSVAINFELIRKYPGENVGGFFFIHPQTFLFPPKNYLRIKILKPTHFARYKSDHIGKKTFEKKSVFGSSGDFFKM